MTKATSNIDIPRPGKPVRGSATGQPIMVLFDLLGRRWAMGIVWNLADGNRTFRALQERCESISPTVLNTRLKELRAANLIVSTESGYALTEQGRELFRLLFPLGKWSEQWSRTL